MGVRLKRREISKVDKEYLSPSLYIQNHGNRTFPLKESVTDPRLPRREHRQRSDFPFYKRNRVENTTLR